MKKLILGAAIFVALVGVLEARTWKSADGSRTFEGELRSFDKNSGEVSVVVNGRLLKFNQSVLSTEDQEFLKSNNPSSSGGSDTAAIAEKLSASKVGAQVAKAKLERLDGKRFKKAEMEKAPEYYILYYSASW